MIFELEMSYLGYFFKTMLYCLFDWTGYWRLYALETFWFETIHEGTKLLIKPFADLKVGSR